MTLPRLHQALRTWQPWAALLSTAGVVLLSIFLPSALLQAEDTALLSAKYTQPVDQGEVAFSYSLSAAERINLMASTYYSRSAWTIVITPENPAADPDRAWAAAQDQMNALADLGVLSPSFPLPQDSWEVWPYLQRFYDVRGSRADLWDFSLYPPPASTQLISDYSYESVTLTMDAETGQLYAISRYCSDGGLAAPQDPLAIAQAWCGYLELSSPTLIQLSSDRSEFFYYSMGIVAEAIFFQAADSDGTSVCYGLGWSDQAIVLIPVDPTQIS